MGFNEDPFYIYLKTRKYKHAKSAMLAMEEGNGDAAAYYLAFKMRAIQVKRWRYRVREQRDRKRRLAGYVG